MPMRIESIWTGIGGVIVGYLLWLVAISIGDNATAGPVGSAGVADVGCAGNLRRGVGLVAAPAR